MWSVLSGRLPGLHSRQEDKNGQAPAQESNDSAAEVITQVKNKAEKVFGQWVPLKKLDYFTDTESQVVPTLTGKAFGIFGRRSRVRKLAMLVFGKIPSICINLAIVFYFIWILFVPTVGPMDYIVSTLFLIEMTMKIVALGLIVGPDTFFRDTGRVFDFFIVALGCFFLFGFSIKPIFYFRVIGIMKSFRKLSYLGGISNYLIVLESATPLLINNTLMLGVMLLLFAAISTGFYQNSFSRICKNYDGNTMLPITGCKNRTIGWTEASTCDYDDFYCAEVEPPVYQSFDNLFTALLIIFQIVSLSNWSELSVFLMTSEDVLYTIIWFVMIISMVSFVLKPMSYGIIASVYRPMPFSVYDKREAAGKLKEKRPTQPESTGYIAKVLHSLPFSIFMQFIVLSNIVACFMIWEGLSTELVIFCKIWNAFCLLIFVIEILLLWHAIGFKKYLSNSARRLEMFCTVCALGGAWSEIYQFNILRGLVIFGNPYLHKLSFGVEHTMSCAQVSFGDFVQVCVLIACIIGLWSLAAHHCFSDLAWSIDRPGFRLTFETGPQAFLTMFIIMTGDDWELPMHVAIEMYGWSTCLFFVTYQLISAWFLLGLIASIVLVGFGINPSERKKILQKKLGMTQQISSAMDRVRGGFSYTLDNIAAGIREAEQGLGMDKGSSEKLKALPGPGADATELNPLELHDAERMAIEIDMDPAVLMHWQRVQNMEMAYSQTCKADEFTDWDSPPMPWNIDTASCPPTPPENPFCLLTPSQKWIWAISAVIDLLHSESPPKWVQVANDPSSLSFWYFAPNHSFRCYCRAVCTSNAFRAFTLLMAMMGVILLGFEDSAEADLTQNRNVTPLPLVVLDAILTIFFTMEALICSVAHTFYSGQSSYMSNPWNFTDFVILLSTYISFLLPELTGIRILRCLRALRFIGRFESLRVVVFAMWEARIGMAELVVMIMYFLFVCSLFGVGFFGGRLNYCNDWSVEGKAQCVGYIELRRTEVLVPRVWITPKRNFDRYSNAFLTLFEVSTLSDWTKIMFQTMDMAPLDPITGLPTIQPRKDLNQSACVFFVIIIILCSFMASNIFVTLITDNIILSRGDAFLTEPQKRWVSLSRHLREFSSATRPPPPPNPETEQWRFLAYGLATNGRVQTVSLVVIQILVLHLVVITRNASTLMVVSDVAASLLVVVLLIECWIKVFALRIRRYFKEPWNAFEFVVAHSILLLTIFHAIFEIKLILSILRVFQAMPILRLVKIRRRLEIIFKTYVRSLPSMLNISFLLAIYIQCFAFIGTQVFGNVRYGLYINKHSNFRVYYKAVYTMFRALTLDSWFDITQDAAIRNPYCTTTESFNDCGSNWAYFFFPVYVGLGIYIFLNVVVGIILDNFEHLFSSECLVSKHTLSQFLVVWTKYDAKCKGVVKVWALPKIMHALHIQGNPLACSPYLNPRAFRYINFVAVHKTALADAYKQRRMAVVIRRLRGGSSNTHRSEIGSALASSSSFHMPSVASSAFFANSPMSSLNGSRNGSLNKSSFNGSPKFASFRTLPQAIDPPTRPPQSSSDSQKPLRHRSKSVSFKAVPTLKDPPFPVAGMSNGYSDSGDNVQNSTSNQTTPSQPYTSNTFGTTVHSEVGSRRGSNGEQEMSKQLDVDDLMRGVQKIAGKASGSGASNPSPESRASVLKRYTTPLEENDRCTRPTLHGKGPRKSKLKTGKSASKSFLKFLKDPLWMLRDKEREECVTLLDMLMILAADLTPTECFVAKDLDYRDFKINEMRLYCAQAVIAAEWKRYWQQLNATTNPDHPLYRNDQGAYVRLMATRTQRLRQWVSLKVKEHTIEEVDEMILKACKEYLMVAVCAV